MHIHVYIQILNKTKAHGWLNKQNKKKLVQTTHGLGSQ